MTNRVNNRTPTNALFPSKPRFRVLIVYEDLSAGLQARRIYENLNSSLQQDCEFQYNMWKLDALEIPRLAQMAAEEAVEADMVIVSGHGRLTRLLREWIEDWLPYQGGHRKALVALLDKSREEVPETAELQLFLKDIAQKGDMDFFHYFAHMQVKTVGPENKSKPAFRLEGEVRFDHSCWGLNE